MSRNPHNPFWDIAIENEARAKQGHAIAAIWHSNWREIGYQYSEKHKARDGKIFLIRGNWALIKGLIDMTGMQYTDEITSPGQEENCRCYYQYLFAISSLPEDLLTAKGKSELARVRKLGL